MSTPDANDLGNMIANGVMDVWQRAEEASPETVAMVVAETDQTPAQAKRSLELIGLALRRRFGS